MTVPSNAPSLRVCIDVPELEAAVRFYTRGLGFMLGRRLGENGAELVGGPCPIDLLQKPEGSSPFDGAPAAERRRYGRHWSPLHLDVVVTDLDAALSRATAHGAKLEQPVREADFGRLALMADPFGNGFCLLEMSARGYG